MAQLGYFQTEYVQRRRWLSEAVYADLVTLCQFLLGPASSQFDFSIGLLRAACPEACWRGWGLPCPRRWRWRCGVTGSRPLAT